MDLYLLQASSTFREIWHTRSAGWDLASLSPLTTFVQPSRSAATAAAKAQRRQTLYFAHTHKNSPPTCSTASLTQGQDRLQSSPFRVLFQKASVLLSFAINITVYVSICAQLLGI